MAGSVTRLGRAVALAATCAMLWPGPSFAYRPFDSTDAAVADLGELEIEFGPAQFRRSDTEQTAIAPAYVFNYGFAKNWEAVLEGQAEHQVSPPEDAQSRLVDNGFFLKGVLRDGVLQDKIGPSIATEFGVLLPGINDQPGFGASLLGIVSQRWSWGTVHFDLGAALTREHDGDLFVGTIVEGPYDWKIRPVAEVDYEREFNVKETFAVLGGAIWRASENLAFDLALREAWVNGRPETEIRAGLTFSMSAQNEAMQRSLQLMRH